MTDEHNGGRCLVFAYQPLKPGAVDFWLLSTEHWLSDEANDSMNGLHCDWPLPEGFVIPDSETLSAIARDVLPRLKASRPWLA